MGKPSMPALETPKPVPRPRPFEDTAAAEERRKSEAAEFLRQIRAAGMTSLNLTGGKNLELPKIQRQTLLGGSR